MGIVYSPPNPLQGEKTMLAREMTGFRWRDSIYLHQPYADHLREA
jgi:hypothetical protein